MIFVMIFIINICKDERTASITLTRPDGVLRDVRCVAHGRLKSNVFSKIAIEFTETAMEWFEFKANLNFVSENGILK